MNIKNIIRSQRVRHLLMKSCAWLPDRIMLPLQYYMLLHRWPDLKHPKRFTEWIQYYKMHYRNPDMLRCVDKYAVRSYVEEKGCSRYLNELYQVCEDATEIDFDKLPQKFVIKTTNGGGGDNVLVVKDKDSLDIGATIQKVNSWLKKNYSNTSREWAYSGSTANPRIIVEKYLENSGTSLDDFKFYCYEGKYRFLSIDKNRFGNHKRAYFDENMQFMPEVTGNYSRLNEAPELPENIQEMVDAAEHFAKDFPFVRVDLYNVQGKVIFGELTFYPASGYSPYSPDDFDFELGKYFKDCKIENWGG